MKDDTRKIIIIMDLWISKNRNGALMLSHEEPGFDGVGSWEPNFLSSHDTIKIFPRVPNTVPVGISCKCYITSIKLNRIEPLMIFSFWNIYMGKPIKFFHDRLKPNTTYYVYEG